MALVGKIDSNTVEVRYAKEDTPGVVSGDETWYPLEPNAITDFGANVTTVSRSPITSDRQRRKGTVTGVEANGKMNHDLIQHSLQDLLQGFMFAALRRKDEKLSGITGVDGGAEQYAAAAGLDAFHAGDLVLASNFGTSANNGLKRVTAAAAGLLTVAENLTTEAGPPATAKLVQIGFQFATGDLSVDVTGDLPVLRTVAKNCTELGLVAGEYIWIGGDTAVTAFATAADAGLCRIRSIAANAITLDKTQAIFTIDAGADKTIQIFFGRALKNETGTSVQTSTYQIERSLGAPDDASPAQIQYEYLVGAYPDEITLTVPTADKVTMDMNFVAMDAETKTGVQGAKAGTRPTMLAEDAFNTSANVARINLAVVSSTNEFPAQLFSFVTDMALTIKNNVKAEKAIGVVGAFGASVGMFEVSGTMTAIFTDVATIAAVRAYSDVTMDMHLFKNNTGISLDVPLLHLGDGRANVEKDQPVKLSLGHVAEAGGTVHANLNHTLMFVFWDYLPTVAM
ncbi:MAG: hypothetical protein EHM35_01230 [Planctomycetaceae bacterium]|nr:MAG: hypothetical protein EHM35_01230 [Planctomycetaceae bacterium]